VGKLLRWAIFILLFFVPLCSPEWFPYLNLIYPVLVLFFYFIFIIDRFFVTKESYTSSPMNFPVLFLSAAFVFAALFSKTVPFNVMNIQLIYFLAIFLVSLNIFSSPVDRKKAAFAVLGGAVFTAIYAFYQKFTGLSDMAVYLDKNKDIVSNPRVYEEFLKNIGAGRVFSTFLNANVFAGYIAMVLPVALGIFLSEAGKGASANNGKSLLTKIGVGFIVVILTASLALTSSVGGMLAVLFSLLVFLLSVIKEKKKVLLAAGALSAAFFAAVLFLRPDILDFSNMDNSVLNRFGYFSEAVKMFMKNPVLGSGVNTYGSLAAGGVKYPHNWYLQTLVETGVLGFGALLIFVCVMVRESIRTLKRMEGRKKLVFAGLFAGFCGFLFHNLLDIDSNLWQNSLTAFALAGITAAGFKSGTKTKNNPVILPVISGYLSRNYFRIFSIVLLSVSIILSASRFENEALIIFVFLSAFLFLSFVSLSNTYIRTKLDIFVIALLFTCFISLVVSVNRFVSFRAVYLLLGCVMVYYSAVNSISKAKDIGYFSFFTGLVCLFVSVAGISQYIWFKADRVDAFFPNPNFLGGFLAAGIGFLLYDILSKKGTIRIFYAVSAVLSFICLLLTKSRGALLAFGIILVFFLFALIILKKKKIVKEPVRFWTTVSILVVIGILITPLNPVVKRAARDGVYDDAAYSRGKIAVSAFKLFKDRPFLGYGLNTFKDIAPKYRFPEGGTIGNYTRVAHHAHNEYLQTMAELGVLGAGLILVFLFVLVNRFITIIKNTKDKGKIFTACAVFTSLTGLFAHALVDFNFHCLPTLIFFVLLTGVLFSGYFTSKKALAAEKPNYFKFKIFAALLVSIFMLLAGMSYLSVYFYKMEPSNAGEFERNMKLSMFLNPVFADSYAGLGKLYAGGYLNTKDKKLFFEAEKNFKQAAKNNPANPEFNRELGLFYFYAGYPSLALQEYAAAIQKSPFDVFFKSEVARICYFEGRYEHAKKYAGEAVSLEPNYAGGHWALYEIYMKQKNTKAAGREKEKALEINKKYRSLATITYERNLVFLGGER